MPGVPGPSENLMAQLQTSGVGKFTGHVVTAFIETPQNLKESFERPTTTTEKVSWAVLVSMAGASVAATAVMPPVGL